MSILSTRSRRAGSAFALTAAVAVSGCAVDAETGGTSTQELRSERAQGNGNSTDTDAGAAETESTTTTGNGAPSGSHYTLNIIGMSRDKNADMTGNSGHRIFVAMEGRTRINLSEGADFAVLDANGTDGQAGFQLPNPDPDNDGVTEYSVYARALGTPGGSAQVTTCATDVATDEEYCSVESTVLVRERGGSKFDNVSRELLYIYADLDGDGSVERYPLFDDALEDYYWGYDNNGLRIAQLRFYPISTDVN